MKTIVTDVDGVILDWETAFHNWMMDEGHQAVSGTEHEWGMHRRFNIERSTATNMVRQFNESAAIGFLKPHKDAVKYINQLAEEGYRFVMLTAFGKDKYAKELRRMNLENLLGQDVDFDLICVDVAERKDKVLGELAEEYTGSYWIEDNPRNAKDGGDVGFMPILMDHPYNRNYEGPIPRVNNWQEIYEIIKENELLTIGA